MKKQLISIVIPVYNEATNLVQLHAQLAKMFASIPYNREIVFVDDGSTDQSILVLEKLAARDKTIRIVEFSRNFGKEIATSAGLNACKGEAAIVMDADMQHPVKLIPDFIALWVKGDEVVVGIRKVDRSKSPYRRFRSWLFYRMLNSMTETKVLPNATDFRLLDRAVIAEFNRFTERNRMTRGLIDWLGFRRSFIYFEADQRAGGVPSYSTTKLLQLALNSFISLSLVPLKVAGWLGIITMVLSGLTGLFIVVEKYALKDPLRYHFSSLATLSVLLVFLVGIILSCLGLIALYVAHIHDEVINRPLYVVRRKAGRL